jgi:hypothetical protein
VTFHNGTFWYFKWPYHAKVINTLEIVKRIIVAMRAAPIPFPDRQRIQAVFRMCGR